MNDQQTSDGFTASRILIVTSVPAERDAVIRGLTAEGAGTDSRFCVIVGGVGPMAAAASTARELAQASYELVISAGIAGGFAGQAEIGSLVIASELVAADLGAETAEGFCSLDELGFGSARMSVAADVVARLKRAMAASPFSVHVGPVLTLSTVTGTSETAAELEKRIPGATAEAMEGFGVATASQAVGVPFAEIRAISNLVGPRDRAAWRIDQALQTLEAASAALREEFR